jgi:signal transduction histidine kinase
MPGVPGRDRSRDLGFLVHAQHRRLLQRVVIQPDHVHDYGGAGRQRLDQHRARPRRRRLLQRLAANLIDNAIRHNIPGGGVDIQVTPDGGRPG